MLTGAIVDYLPKGDFNPVNELLEGTGNDIYVEVFYSDDVLFADAEAEAVGLNVKFEPAEALLTGTEEDDPKIPFETDGAKRGLTPT